MTGGAIPGGWETHTKEDELRQRIAELEARPVITWIPVVERIPATMLRVLAAYNDGRTTTTIRALHIPASTVTCSEYNVDMVEIADYDEATGNYYYPAGWYECVESADDYSYIGPLTGTVTHWALPPALPKMEVKP